MSEEKAEYYVSKAPKALRRLDYLRVRFQSWVRGLSVEGRCYFLGVLLAVVASIFVLARHGENGRPFFLMGAFIFAYGLIAALTRAYEIAWSTVPGKVVIAGIVALATSVAHGIGRQFVAGIVGTDPAPFGATITMATLLVSPVLFLFALAIGGLFLIIIGTYACTAIGYWEMLTGQRILSRNAVLWVCRVAAVLIATGGAYWLLNHSPNYTKWVESRAAGYLYNFDMYQDSHYAKGKGEKIAFLADGRVLVGGPKAGGDGYVFEARRSEEGEK
jgi:hypothetical protein